jgi:hypothetical protein
MSRNNCLGSELTVPVLGFSSSTPEDKTRDARYANEVLSEWKVVDENDRFCGIDFSKALECVADALGAPGFARGVRERL